MRSDGATEIYDVGTGPMALDIDAYFTPPRPGEQVDLNTLPLLMPTENNLRALSQHIAKRLPDALKAYGIPSAPAYVRYDSSGNWYCRTITRMPTSSRPCSTNSQRCRGS